MQGAKPLEALSILYFTVPGKGLKTRLKTLSYHGEILPVLRMFVIPALNFKTGKVLQTTHCTDSTLIHLN